MTIDKSTITVGKLHIRYYKYFEIVYGNKYIFGMGREEPSFAEKNGFLLKRFRIGNILYVYQL